MKLKLILLILITWLLMGNIQGQDDFRRWDADTTQQIDTSKIYTWTGSYYNPYKPDTTHIPFRGDTLRIVEGYYDMLSLEGRILIANLDFFGLPYWEILQKHKIQFETYIQNQLIDIFLKEKMWSYLDDDEQFIQEIRRRIMFVPD